MANVMFYEKPVALNREAHRNVKIGELVDFSFAAKTNSVILTGIEFTEACKEYPLVFANIGGDKFVPVALLGLRDSENLFVDEAGKWDARYIPASVRRYPFVLAGDGLGEMTVFVDESSPVFNAEKGQPLFVGNDGNSEFLQRMLSFLSDYQGQFVRTEGFIGNLKKLGLLTEMSAKAEMKDGSSFVLNGLMVVDEKKLLELDMKDVEGLYKSGEMGWIYAHLISLGNMNRLTDRLAARLS